MRFAFVFGFFLPLFFTLSCSCFGFVLCISCEQRLKHISFDLCLALSRWLSSWSLVCVCVCICECEYTFFHLHQSPSSFFIYAIWSFCMNALVTCFGAFFPPVFFSLPIANQYMNGEDYIKSFFNCLDIANGHIQSTSIVCICTYICIHFSHSSFFYSAVHISVMCLY